MKDLQQEMFNELKRLSDLVFKDTMFGSGPIWAMGNRMTKELVIRCLNQASGRRSNPRGILIHSDRGSQYCSNDYQSLLNKYGFTYSMSRKGNCWGNAPMESFWGKPNRN